MIHKNVEQEIEQQKTVSIRNKFSAIQFQFCVLFGLELLFDTLAFWFFGWTQEQPIHEVVIVINDSFKVLTRFRWIPQNGFRLLAFLRIEQQ